VTSRRGSATRRRRSTRRRRRAASTFRLSGRLVREVLALVLMLLAIISVIALFAPNAGAIVQPWHDLLERWLGWGIAFAAPLLVGFALMLWMKALPAERWMAASGATLVALSLLGMFQLGAGGGGIIGSGVNLVVSGAVGVVGGWVVLALLLVVGLLLYFNMTLGDVVAAWMQRREDRLELEEVDARRSTAAERRQRGAQEPDPQLADGARAGLLARVRGALGGGADQDEPPVIVRRQRPEPAANGAAEKRPALEAIPVRPAEAPVSIEALETDESAHLAELSEGAAPIDAALEATQRSSGLATARAAGRCAGVERRADGSHRQGAAHSRDAGKLQYRRQGGAHPGRTGRHPVRARRRARHQAEPHRGAGR